MHDSLKRAAAHLPRVDAIGGSAAGVYVNNEVRAAVGDTGGRGLLVAPGCSVPPRVRDANLAAVMSGMAA